ncbi:MAG: VCBS repeat-containing protein [Planctomycetes bacterium]|nr:VCBS repeat-containing protein [Planctomycetota bacterium]
MGSQFVDLDGDGHVDYLTATFDGSPHVARGGEGGFAAPVHLFDKDGARVILSYYWDHEKNQHLIDQRAMPEGSEAERLVSVLAFDWDGDGDRDLLLGSYENGHLYRQMNEGTDAEPRYTGKNLPVMAGGKAFAIGEKLTAPVLVDWDGDGDLDLVAGGFGESYGDDPVGGGVYLSRNGGKAGAPDFGPLEVLVAPSEFGAREAVRPDTGLYPAVCDWDGDGDLDLLVGGYSIFQPEAPPLSAEEEAEVAALRERIGALQAEMDEFWRELEKAVAEATKGLEEGSEEYDARYTETWEALSPRHRELQNAMDEPSSRLDELVPGRRQESHVWWYERV